MNDREAHATFESRGDRCFSPGFWFPSCFPCSFQHQTRLIYLIRLGSSNLRRLVRVPASSAPTGFFDLSPSNGITIFYNSVPRFRTRRVRRRHLERSENFKFNSRLEIDIPKVSRCILIDYADANIASDERLTRQPERTSRLTLGFAPRGLFILLFI